MDGADVKITKLPAIGDDVLGLRFIEKHGFGWKHSAAEMYCVFAGAEVQEKGHVNPVDGVLLGLWRTKI